jgi:beta-galactosidase
MKKKFALLFLVSCISIVHAQRKIQSFDNNWKFIKEDVNNGEQVSFNDAAWRNINVPHDWSIEGPYDRANTTGRGGGFLPSGIGWYRKVFLLNEADAKNKVFIEFDGIMANSDVWINGYHLGKRPNGYASFQYELTGHLYFGNKANIISLRADNSVQPASRWYTGAGIYRHVRLVITQPVHVAHWGVFVSTANVSANSADVNVQTTINNQSSSPQNIVLQTNIIAHNGTMVTSSETKQKLNANAVIALQQKINIVQPLLWSLENTQQYRAVTKIIIDKKAVDETTTYFGIRNAKFDAATGFWLNDKNIKLKGVCLHHDGGAFGAAVPLGVWKAMQWHRSF